MSFDDGRHDNVVGATGTVGTTTVKGLSCAVFTVTGFYILYLAPVIENEDLVLQVVSLVVAHVVVTAVAAVLPTVFQTAPGILAFELVGTVAVCHLAWIGTPIALAQLNNEYWAHAQELEGARTRLFGFVQLSAELSTKMATYSLWELYVLLAVPSLRSWDSMIHHFAVVVGIAVGMVNPMMCGFYAPFFCGMQELSSIVLGLVGIFKKFHSVSHDRCVFMIVLANIVHVLYLSHSLFCGCPHRALVLVFTALLA
jgi:hypothetical protein